MSKKEFELELFNEALLRYEAEYEELSEIWKNLEAKAQATLAISGTLIAASSLLAKKNQDDFPDPMNLILACAIILLGLSVACSVISLMVKQTESSPQGHGYYQFAIELTQALEGESDESNIIEYKINLVKDKIRIWHQSIHSRRSKSEHKALQLRTAQCLLLISLILVAVTTIFQIF
jgi:hypothetical protein